MKKNLNKTPEQIFKENYYCQFIDDGMTKYDLCGCFYKFDIKRNKWRLKRECEYHKNMTLKITTLRGNIN